MFKQLTVLAFIASSASFALPAHGCDMHGAGFGGFGSAGAHWKPYSFAPNRTPYAAEQKTIEEPAMPKPLAETAPAKTLMSKTLTSKTLASKNLLAKKARPSFSNAANRAALAAKKSIAQKSKIADSAKQPL